MTNPLQNQTFKFDLNQLFLNFHQVIDFYYDEIHFKIHYNLHILRFLYLLHQNFGFHINHHLIRTNQKFDLTMCLYRHIIFDCHQLRSFNHFSL
jgi:hypothetical protein